MRLGCPLSNCDHHEFRQTLKGTMIRSKFQRGDGEGKIVMPKFEVRPCLATDPEWLFGVIRDDRQAPQVRARTAIESEYGALPSLAAKPP
jgi:hypothetical protein